jgi:MFS family permease
VTGSSGDGGAPGPSAPGAGPVLVSPAVFSERARVPAALAPLVPLFVLDVLTAFTVGMVPPLLPLVVDSWALSAVEAGLVNTAYAVGRLAGNYPAGHTRARWGTRAAVFGGLAGLAAGSVACALAPTFPLFLAARVVMGLGASVSMFAVFAELLEAAPAGWRGRAANGFEATAILSVAAGSVLAAAVAQRAGWRVVFVGATVVVALTVVTWRAIPSRAGRRRAAAGGGGWTAAASLRALAPVYWACLAMSLTWAGLFATVLPLVGDRRYGLPAGAIGLAMGAGYLADVVVLTALAVLIDRVRQDRLFLGGAATAMAGAALLVLGAAPAAFVAATVLIACGFAVWMVPATVLTARVGTPLPAAPLAILRVAMDLGMILGPLASGALVELAGDRTAVLATAVVFVAGAAGLAGRRGRV